MMGWYGSGWSQGWMLLVMALVWGMLLALAVWAVVALTRRDTRGSEAPVPTPRQILDSRLAAGEVNPEEYLAARRLIERGGAPGRAATGPGGR